MRPDATPNLLECLAVARLAGNEIELSDGLNIMQALPARPAAVKEVSAGKGVFQEVAPFRKVARRDRRPRRPRPIQFDTMNKFKIPGLARVLIQKRQHMYNCLILLGITRKVVSDSGNPPKVPCACKVRGTLTGA